MLEDVLSVEPSEILVLKSSRKVSRILKVTVLA